MAEPLRSCNTAVILRWFSAYRAGCQWVACSDPWQRGWRVCVALRLARGASRRAGAQGADPRE